MSRIQGGLPWQQMGAGAGMFSAAAGSDPQMRALGANYGNAYNSALALNQANYQNILQGYQQTAEQQAQQQAGISNQYGQLQNNVLGGIAGVGGAQRQSIQDAYAGMQGRATQQLINQGLGNSTVRQSVQRGIGLDEQKAYTDLADRMAQLRAGYQSQLGLAGLGYQANAQAQQGAQANQQLAWMNSVEAPFPDAGAYGSLMAQRGQGIEADKNRQQQADLFQQMLNASRPQQAQQQGQQGVQVQQGAVRNLGTAYRPARNVNTPLAPRMWVQQAGLNRPPPPQSGVPFGALSGRGPALNQRPQMRPPWLNVQGAAGGPAPGYISNPMLGAPRGSGFAGASQAAVMGAFGGATATPYEGAATTDPSAPNYIGGPQFANSPGGGPTQPGNPYGPQAANPYTGQQQPQLPPGFNGQQPGPPSPFVGPQFPSIEDAPFWPGGLPWPNAAWDEMPVPQQQQNRMARLVANIPWGL